MPASEYTLSFINGAATMTLPVGSYTVSAIAIPGYEDAVLEGFTIGPDTTELSLSMTAAGTLTVTVTGDLGPADKGELQLSSADGQDRYGPVQSVGADGLAVFPNVPHSAEGVALHLAQDATADYYTPLSAPQAVSMTAKEQAETVYNARKQVSVRLTLADGVYPGAAPIDGAVTVSV